MFFLTITLAVVFIVVLVLFITSKTKTRPFLDKTGKLVENSIAEELKITIGGVEQYILLRGRNKSNPILVFLHGGPGATVVNSLFRYYHSKLEDHFLVTYWDQRGAGKSYSKKISQDSMNIDQFVSDLDELIKYLKKRFNKNKVYLIGESWGSLLGILYAKKHPENIEAYIGIGQISNPEKSELLGYEWTLQEAKKRNNKKAIKELESIKNPPGKFVKDVKKERKWLIKFGGQLYKRSGYLLHWIPKILTVNEYSWLDLIRLIQGLEFSLNLLWHEIYRTNLFESVRKLDVPVYFFLGKHDHCVSSKLAEEYLEFLQAPSKKLVWFKDSGHNPPFEEPEEFNKTVIKCLLAKKYIKTL